MLLLTLSVQGIIVKGDMKYMNPRVIGIVASIAMACAFAGCVPSAPPETPPVAPPTQTVAVPEAPTTSALIEEWITQVTALGEVNLNRFPPPREVEIAMAIMAMLREAEPETLNPLIEAIADPELPLRSKIWGTSFLKEDMTPVHLPILSALLDPANDVTTRGCAISLLSGIDSPKVVEILRGAMDDPEPRISLAAMLGVARSGDETVRKKLVVMYSDPQSTVDVQTAIISLIIEKPTCDDIDFLLLTLDNDAIDITTRSDVSNHLGRFGDVRVLEPMIKARDRMTDPALKYVVGKAITVLEMVAKQQEPNLAPGDTP